MVEECISVEVTNSAKTELEMAKQQNNRLIATLGRIFGRIKSRFVIKKWLRYSKLKRMAREKEEEKKRQELWNFPSINSYSLSTKDVLKAFCGKSTAQPSLNKVELLNRSPDDILTANSRPKRKSDGTEGSDSFTNSTPTKYPRLESQNDQGDSSWLNKMRSLWNFPVGNPYRTNRQVLEDFCGSSSLINLPVSPKVTIFNTANARSNTSPSFTKEDNNSSFTIHRPAVVPTLYDRTDSKEILTKANESIADLLKNIKQFTSQVQEENEKSTDLQPFVEEINMMDRTYSELNSPSLGQSFMETSEDAEMFDEMERPDELTVMQPSFITGIFLEEENLLHKIKSFVRDVKKEKALSWNTDTFLNNIDIHGVL